MTERVESVGITLGLATTNYLAWAQSIEWGATTTGLTMAGFALIGLYIKLMKDKAYAEIDIQRERMKLEADKERQTIAIQKERDLSMAGTLSSQLAEISDQLRSAKRLLELKERELKNTEDFARSVEDQLNEMRREQAEKRHELRNDVAVAVTNLRADVIEGDQKIAQLESQLTKTTVATKKNAKAIHVIAEHTDMEPIETGNPDGTSGDLPTLAGPSTNA